MNAEPLRLILERNGFFSGVSFSDKAKSIEGRVIRQSIEVLLLRYASQARYNYE